MVSESDVKGNTDKDVGLLRVYNSDKCQLLSTTCKIKDFTDSYGKLALLLLLKLLHIPSVLGFYISVKGIFTCLFMFGIIFLMILFLNLAKIHLSRPVELLRGNNTGEKEPVAKWLMALIGFICLGAGYYLAVTTESPIKAITIFLLAVILVIYEVEDVLPEEDNGHYLSIDLGLHNLMTCYDNAGKTFIIGREYLSLFLSLYSTQ